MKKMFVLGATVFVSYRVKRKITRSDLYLDIVKPQIKHATQEIVRDAVEAFLFGEPQRHRRRVQPITYGGRPIYTRDRRYGDIPPTGRTNAAEKNR